MDLYQEINDRVYVIAEMSGNHAGSLERAKEIIHSAKDSGADCIKIQTYTADTMTIDCNNSYFRINSGTWNGENLYSLYQKACTPWEWQEDLYAEAIKVGIDFFSTPFDKTSVDFLEGLGVEFYKVASFELVDIPLIQYIASKKKPIILSTGMASVEEIQEAVDVVKPYGNQIVLLKCSSAYPAISDDMNLKTIVNMQEIFGLPIGLSDHSRGYIGATTAVALGAKIIEKHFCISRKIENPDCSFSMEPNEFKEMVQQIRQVEKALGTISYSATESEKDNIGFRRSIFAIQDIKKGETLNEHNIKVIRPGYGLKPKYYEQVLGRIALKNIDRGTPLSFEQIGEKHL